MAIRDTNAWKQAAADAAVREVEPDMLVGLGTGSTAALAVAALGARARAGLKITTVATSKATATAAEAAGLRVIDMADVDRLDLAIDGVDEIDPQLRAIKGAGGALLREKVVATAARRMIAIADGSKQVARLGGRPVPLEILPFARSFVCAAVTVLGGAPILRAHDTAPALTDQGNILIDCHFPLLDDPDTMALALGQIPGVLGHGLFVREIDSLYVARSDGVSRFERSGSPTGEGR